MALWVDSTAPGGVTWLLVAGPIAGLMVWYATTALLSWWRLRHIPGPWLASFSYLWLASVQRSGRMGLIYRGLPAQYSSPVVRIGPREVMTDDADTIRRINSARTRYVRDGWYLGGRWNPYDRHFFNELDSQVHDVRKSRVLNAYTGKGIDSLEGSHRAGCRTRRPAPPGLSLIRRHPAQSRLCPAGFVFHHGCGH